MTTALLHLYKIADPQHGLDCSKYCLYKTSHNFLTKLMSQNDDFKIQRILKETLILVPTPERLQEKVSINECVVRIVKSVLGIVMPNSDPGNRL